jgi:2-polyprenyl-3-methyl-5-hydroxy-6-metoxy-1,4-benzoquinol methylase
MSTRSEHWQNVYTTKGERDVSWFQAGPKRSLALIREAAPDNTASVIDIGGGASSLAGELLEVGYRDVAVLDISPAALERAKSALGEAGAKIAWVAADITQWQPPRRWHVWHDRAVFHFLTATQDQEAYIRALDAGTAPGAAVVISTFALDGPEKCSGLPVERYSAETLAARLGPGFRLMKAEHEDHHTPGGAVQKFSYAVLRKI